MHETANSVEEGNRQHFVYRKAVGMSNLDC